MSTATLLGSAQDLGNGRYGVLVNQGDVTYYVEHAVTPDGLVAQIWDEAGEVLITERQMGWDEVIGRTMTVWQQGDA